MFPIVSSELAFRWSHMRSTLLPMSNTESMPVARSESDSDVIAAYTNRPSVSVSGLKRDQRERRHERCKTERLKLAMRLAQTAILTCTDQMSDIGHVSVMRSQAHTGKRAASTSARASSVCSSIGLSRDSISYRR